MSAAPHPSDLEASDRRRVISRIGVGIDGYPEGEDAAALGDELAAITGAELMLIAVHSDPIVVLPAGLDWRSLRHQAETTLNDTRDRLGAGARTIVETDLSVPRALQRVVQREHRDLLAVGSSRHAPEGHVRIGKRTRQLLCAFECPLAIAPRGFRDHRWPKLTRVGVGYEGGPESQAALALAGSLANATGAELHVRGVVDDRLPSMGWGRVWLGEITDDFDHVVHLEMNALGERASDEAGAIGAEVRVETVHGRPADRLLELAGEVDLLVIGSRRWGPLSRVLLGSTGEALAHDAPCPLLVVPRPHD